MIKKAILLGMLVPFFAQAKDVAVVENKAQVEDLSKVKHPVKPMLWEVSKKGLAKKSYLFGTIHVSDPRITNLHPAAQKAFDGADRLYTEVDMDPANMVKASAIMMRKDGKKLSESLGEELTAQVTDELKAIHPALDLRPFESMKTWFMIVGLPQLAEQFTGKVSLDNQLWNRAAKAGKVTKALETYEEQSRGLNALTEEEQVFLTKETLKGMKMERESEVKSIDTMKNLYIHGDQKKITDYFVKEFGKMEMDEKLKKKFISGILYERNQRITDNIDKFLTADSDESHFFAVGTLHYLGDKNIRQMLVKKGYTVTAVTK